MEAVDSSALYNQIRIDILPSTVRIAFNITCASQRNRVTNAWKTRSFASRFLRFTNALANAPIKWLHKNAKIAFVRVFVSANQNCDSISRFFVTSRANAFAI